MTDAWDRPYGSGGRAAGGHPGPRVLEPDGAVGRPTRRSGVPAQRSAAGHSAAGRSAAGRSTGQSAGQPAGRQGGRRAPEQQRHGAIPALVLILAPLVAALVSGGTGVVFWAGSLIGAIGAAALCSRPGVWWVSTGTPPVVLLMALAGLVVGDSSAKTSKLGTDLAKVVAGAFPVMGVALLCALVVGVVRVTSARKARGNGRG